VVHHPILLCIADVCSPPAILEDPPRGIIIIVSPTDPVFLSILDFVYVQNNVTYLGRHYVFTILSSILRYIAQTQLNLLNDT